MTTHVIAHTVQYGIHIAVLIEIPRGLVPNHDRCSVLIGLGLGLVNHTCNNQTHKQRKRKPIPVIDYQKYYITQRDGTFSILIHGLGGLLIDHLLLNFHSCFDYFFMINSFNKLIIC
jgi:hypothetical protein